MSGLIKTLWGTLILNDTAYRDWRDRPNLFWRGILLVVVVSLIAGLVTFGINLVAQVRPVDPERVRVEMKQAFDQALNYNPGWQQADPEVQQMVEENMQAVGDMVIDIMKIQSPLPRGIAGFFEALGTYLTAGLGALAGWLAYGALVLVAVNLLGGSAKLSDFLGMVSLYAIPGLIGLLGWVPCVGGILAFIGFVWGVVMYVKATSVGSGLDTGKSVLAVILPALAITVLASLLAALLVVWLLIIF